MDPLTITIIFIVLSTIMVAFIKGRMRDKCLIDFVGDLVNIELKDNKVVWGFLRLEATGLELKYKEHYLNKNNNHIEASVVLYKNEYPNIQCIIRFLDELSDRNKKKRDRSLHYLYHQKGLWRMKRNIRNFFATIKDSIMEVANLLMGKAKQMAPMGKVLSSQDKYVSQMQTGAFSSLDTSFEPLLEKHIGKKVILQLSREGKIIEYLGILKRYTAQFLELINVDYCSPIQENRARQIF